MPTVLSQRCHQCLFSIQGISAIPIILKRSHAVSLMIITHKMLAWRTSMGPVVTQLGLAHQFARRSIVMIQVMPTNQNVQSVPSATWSTTRDLPLALVRGITRCLTWSHTRDLLLAPARGIQTSRRTQCSRRRWPRAHTSIPIPVANLVQILPRPAAITPHQLAMTARPVS